MREPRPNPRRRRQRSARVGVEPKDDSLQWAAEHFPELLAKYQGTWILIRSHDVVDSSSDSVDLLKRAIGRGIKNPLMLWVETPPPTGLNVFLAYRG